jgi:ABC-type phosphate transport system substrate-binding protein
MRNAWLLPVLAGAVAIGFNLPELANLELKIPRDVLAAIFLGRIRQWSELATWNPALERMQQNISLVVRSDRCGASEVLSRALASFSTEWNGKVGTSSKPNWPIAGFRAEGGPGMAVAILSTAYSLGYVSQIEAATFNVRMAHISNAEGIFVAPTIGGVQSAMDAFATELDEIGRRGETNFDQNIVDPKNRTDAYPISTLTYFAFDAASLNCETLHDVLYLIYWAWTDPQAAQIALDQGSSPISKSVRGALLSALWRLRCGNNAVLMNLLLSVIPGCKPGTRTIVKTGCCACRPLSELKPSAQSPLHWCALDHCAYVPGHVVNFTDPLNVRCAPCEPGFFSLERSSTACTVCKPGTHAAKRSQLSPVLCSRDGTFPKRELPNRKLPIELPRTDPSQWPMCVLT